MEIITAVSKFFGGLFGVLFLAIAILFGSSLIIAFPVEWLWNYLMPSLFNLKEIGYWQAFCLLLLSGFLFKSNISKTKSENKEK